MAFFGVFKLWLKSSRTYPVPVYVCMCVCLCVSVCLCVCVCENWNNVAEKSLKKMKALGAFTAYAYENRCITPYTHTGHTPTKLSHTYVS